MNLEEEFEKIQQKRQSLAQNMTGEDKAKAVVNLAKEPENMVRVAVSNKVVEKLTNDESTIARLDETVDKIVDSATITIENEADANENKSHKDKLQTYFDAHKEELKTAGIDKPTYIEDMERGVKCHRKWSNIHWKLFGCWQTGIRTFLLKAKPFKLWLNLMAILVCMGITSFAVWGIIKLIWLIA